MTLNEQIECQTPVHTDTLIDWHKYCDEVLGVAWTLYSRDFSGVMKLPMFGSFTRFGGSPKGNGAIALKGVLERWNKPLCLFTYNQKLVDYYTQFGFELKPHPKFQFYMEWTPRSVQ